MFKLNIECTKDISYLKIDFSDGESACVVGEKSEKPEKPKSQKRDVPHKTNNTEEIGSTYSDLYDKIDRHQGAKAQSFPKVELPEVPERDKGDFKIAPELHNLEI